MKKIGISKISLVAGMLAIGLFSDVSINKASAYVAARGAISQPGAKFHAQGAALAAEMERVGRAHIKKTAL